MEQELTDAEVRSVLKAQAQAMPRVKLPRAGTTKPYARGRFGRRQRMRLRMMRELRANRARWLKGDFKPGELDDVRNMIKQMRDVFQQTPLPLWKRIINKLKFWR